MIVYQIKPDLEKYMSFYPVEDDANLELQLAGYLKFKGKSRDDWHGISVYLSAIDDDLEEELTIADITRFNANAFAFSEKAVEALREILEESGELLQFEHDGRQWYIHNVLNTVSALDYENSGYELDDDGKFSISRKVIDKSKLNDISLFKLKENNFTIVHCKEMEDKSRDFKYQVEKHGLTGLKFMFKS